MKATKNNDRLAAALKMASKPKRKRAKSTYYFADPKNANKAREKWLKERGPKIKTSTMRIQEDAIALAQSAWPKSEERISATSGVIREAAKKRLGL